MLPTTLRLHFKHLGGPEDTYLRLHFCSLKKLHLPPGRLQRIWFCLTAQKVDLIKKVIKASTFSFKVVQAQHNCVQQLVPKH